jgi:hypothetical protein
MEAIAQQIAGFLRIELVHGYLIIGVAIGFILPPVLKLLLGQRGRSATGGKTVMVAEERGSIDVEIDGRKFDIDSVAMAEIRRLTGKGNKIEAIKRLRATSGLGLNEAKQIVDALERLKQ